MAKNTELCARCGVAPRNSTLKSYCVDCKRELARESYERLGGKNPVINCSRCGNERTGRHPAYCVGCWKAKRAERAMGPCAKCGAPKDPAVDTLNVNYCQRCARDGWLRRRFGISLVDFERVLDRQGGRCAICCKESNGRQWHVDHDHETGRVRGLLCDKCNRGLGHFDEDPILLRRAADYLEADASV